VTTPTLRGFVNGAPYVIAALSGPALNFFLNQKLGRRGTLAFGCFFAFVTAILQAVSPNLGYFIASRMILGLAVGVMSSTTPVYAAETAPAAVRGAMTMMWQMWTAAGIMLGLGVSAGLRDFNPGGSGSLSGPHSQWRIMMGLTAIPPLVVGLLIYTLPESPRYYLEKGEVAKAFYAMRRLRKNNVLAARDVYLSLLKLRIETQLHHGAPLWQRLRDSLKTRRTLRAFQSSWFVMIMQQMCGGKPETPVTSPWTPNVGLTAYTVNAIAYYSTSMFIDAGYTRQKAMEVSVGFGAINFTFAVCALWLIDRAGRRPLLIYTFPIMSLCLFWTGGSYMISEDSIRTVSTMASIFAAEAFPLDIRALAMASSTSVTWMLNFVVSFSWPKLKEAWGVEGAFFWYACWNVVGFVFTLLLLPETKGRTLEDMDMVFAVRNRDHVKYQCRIMANFWRRGEPPADEVPARPGLSVAAEETT
jgi:MFS family permease